LTHQLKQLAFLDLIDYIPQYEGFLVRLLIPRQQPEQLVIDIQKWQARKEAELKRIGYLKDYAIERLECRQAYIIKYFEKGEDNFVCGICDNCQRNAKKAESLKTLEQLILAKLIQPQSTSSLLEELAHFSEDEVWHALRLLLDSNKVIRTPDGVYHLA